MKHLQLVLKVETEEQLQTAVNITYHTIYVMVNDVVFQCAAQPIIECGLQDANDSR